MQRDRDRRPPASDEPELIPADADARRSRSVPVKLMAYTPRRTRLKRVDTFARQILEDAARETHGPVAVTPALPNRFAVGDTVVVDGRPWTVGAVCPCTPLGWARLDPQRTVADSNQPLPKPRFSEPRCAHVRAPMRQETERSPIRPTVPEWHEPGDPVGRALSLRERYVADLMARAAANEEAGRSREAALQMHVALRADAMTDDAWLAERRVRAGHRD